MRNRLAICLFLLLSIFVNNSLAQHNEKAQVTSDPSEYLHVTQRKNQSLVAAFNNAKLTDNEREIITQIPIISNTKSNRVFTIGFLKLANARQIVEISVENDSSLVVFDVDTSKTPAIFTSNHTKLAKRLHLTEIASPVFTSESEVATKKSLAQGIEPTQLTISSTPTVAKSELTTTSPTVSTTKSTESSAKSTLNQTISPIYLPTILTNPIKTDSAPLASDKNYYITNDAPSNMQNFAVNSAKNVAINFAQNAIATAKATEVATEVNVANQVNKDSNADNSADSEQNYIDQDSDISKIRSLLEDFIIAIREKIAENADDLDNDVIASNNVDSDNVLNKKENNGFVYWGFSQKQGQTLDDSIADLPLSNLQKRLIKQIPINKNAKTDRQFGLLFEKNKTGDGNFLKAMRIIRDKNIVSYILIRVAGRFMFADENGMLVAGSEFDRYPVKFSRVSSKFNPKRMNPVLHKIRPHLGVDLKAEYGAKVWAPADGIVKSAGWQHGYGYCVEIKHDNGYTTKYAHLSKIPKNIKFGVAVKHGQTVGFVGSTGLSTGTHLHYEVIVNGVHKNPQTVALPNAKKPNKDYVLLAKKYFTELDKLSNNKQ